MFFDTGKKIINLNYVKFYKVDPYKRSIEFTMDSQINHFPQGKVDYVIYATYDSCEELEELRRKCELLTNPNNKDHD